MNAYATGTGNRAQVVFTKGLIELLNQDKVRAVATHELGHVANRDARLVIWATRSGFRPRRLRDRRRPDRGHR